jgi:hypothetical protein
MTFWVVVEPIVRQKCSFVNKNETEVTFAVTGAIEIGG